MTITLCDRCDTEGATWCSEHQLDECETCAKGCVIA